MIKYGDYKKGSKKQCNFEEHRAKVIKPLSTRMNENLQFLANSRRQFKEFQLFQQQLRQKYGENIPPEFLEEITCELKRFRLKFSEEASKVNPPKKNFL